MYNRTCDTCSKEFQTSKVDGDICYDCALLRVTGGSLPEEGDFNTARIVSGEMTEKQWRWLQEDLKSIEPSEDPNFERDFSLYDYDDVDEGGY